MVPKIRGRSTCEALLLGKYCRRPTRRRWGDRRRGACPWCELSVGRSRWRRKAGYGLAFAAPEFDRRAGSICRSGAPSGAVYVRRESVARRCGLRAAGIIAGGNAGLRSAGRNRCVRPGVRSLENGTRVCSGRRPVRLAPLLLESPDKAPRVVAIVKIKGSAQWVSEERVHGPNRKCVCGVRA